MALTMVCSSKKSHENRTVNQHKPAIENAQRSIVGLLIFKWNVVHIHAEGPAFFCWLPKLFEKRVVTIHGECEIIRGCHNRDKGTAENERLRDSKFIFSYPKNERLILLSGRNAAQKEISTMRVG